jgi:DNA-binding XRE family transcriptional regulator
VFGLSAEGGHGSSSSSKKRSTDPSQHHRRVRARRSELGLTRAAVAVEAAVGLQAVDRVEQERAVMLSSLLAICEALGLSLEVR